MMLDDVLWVRFVFASVYPFCQQLDSRLSVMGHDSIQPIRLMHRLWKLLCPCGWAVAESSGSVGRKSLNSGYDFCPLIYPQAAHNAVPNG